MYVLANKQDSNGALKPEDISSKLNLSSYEGKRPYLVKGISAKDGTDIKEAMDELAKEIKKFYKEKANKKKDNE